MIYLWTCSGCGMKFDVIRHVGDRDVPPKPEEIDVVEPDGCVHQWQRSITGPRRIFVPERYNPETGRE